MSYGVLIAPDKFKGTLTAREAARAMARGWARTRPTDTVEIFPISDGGDGFGETLGELVGAQRRRVRTVNAAHQPCTAAWWWDARRKTAIIESARVIGLAMLPPGKFHPFDLDTFGLGAVVRQAVKEGAEHCVIGIGGSSTNDGGFGLARSLGWRFLDANGRELERWTELDSLARLVRPPRRRWFKSWVVAVDVRNPLLGARGATRVYGPQKGLRPADFPVAERCLKRLVFVAQQARFTVPPANRSQRLKPGRHTQPGAGAAGGLGFGLTLFFGARFTPGFDLIAQRGGLAGRLARADLVVTGEGAMDRSTLMGKGAGQVAAWCRARDIPCVALAGALERSPQLARHFTRLHALTDLTTVAEAKARAAFWLERLAAHAAGQSALV
ncbi:MAG: glycerate kinase [Verrucomicrobia bacterium]|jgi:glycerate kinase|nr:glycerate kinase [Verrucomicrobiota bacterium]